MTAHRPTAPPQPPRPNGAWLKLSAAMTAQVPAIAARDDLIVTCTPGAGDGHPACFWPDTANIELNGSLLGIDPATADPASPTDRDRYPAAWGALTHECAHAAHTRWAPPLGTAAAWAQAAALLEESRIEHAQLTRRPADRRWLRATATAIILKDLTAAAVSAPDQAASAAALLLARTDAGVLDEEETRESQRAVLSVLGTDTLARLRDVWQEAHRTADTDARTMVKLGRRWCRILGITPDQPAPAVGNDADPSQPPSPVTRAVAADTATITRNVAAENAPPRPDPGKAAERDRENTARQCAASAAGRVFRDTQTTATYRDPTAAEQSAARKLASALRAATAGGRAATMVTSAVPPGRLSMRRALARNAQRAAGAMPTAEPFTRTQRRRVPAPPLRVGIACDISRSMRRFTEPVASAAWILARATASLPAATTATVIYGHDVTPVTRPGQVPGMVATFNATAAAHELATAIDALDGALDLSRPGAARLLVVVSDGIYNDDERDPARQRITRLTAAGCAVLWLAPETASAWPATCAQVTALADPATAIDTIARAATRALNT